jgi:hypothetical protein
MNPWRKRSRIFVSNAADHAGAPGVTVSLTKPSLTISKMFHPTGRSSVPSSAASILDQ